MKVDNITAIVTGGASGLGGATAAALVAAGARVTILDMNAETGSAHAAAIGARFVETNVTDEAAVTAALDAAEADGPLRIAINCAGIGSAMKTLGREGEAHLLKVFETVVSVNLIGSFNVARLAAARIAKTDPLEGGERGVIINTASIAAYDGQMGQIAYAASKGGIVAMTLPMARDLARSLIRVVTIAPGLFETPLLMGLPEEARLALGASVPHPARLGDPTEFASLACEVVRNPMLNGEVIRLDGALRMAPR